MVPIENFPAYSCGFDAHLIDLVGFTEDLDRFARQHDRLLGAPLDIAVQDRAVAPGYEAFRAQPFDGSAHWGHEPPLDDDRRPYQRMSEKFARACASASLRFRVGTRSISG